ncbi:hypothetical protein KVF89_28610 [Nocardioides carbamazepini]|uniref:hypothetical protein n=1 Tax=Nocardioides carbamazepini TaxID=2854259 RepID=UPI00214A31A2|nr:hypothetical protein [Nocardioides carbamazepini]MCR1786530.1 hypothetical protein [Nocardioides carbamazepini]
MTDLIDTDLAARLYHLSDGAPVPTVATADDVRRGRGRLRRRRLARVGAGGTTLAVATVTGLALGVPGTQQAAPAPTAQQPPAVQAPQQAPRQVPQQAPGEAVAAKVEALARTQGHAVVRLDQLLAMSSVLEDDFGRETTQLAIGASVTWQGAGADECPAGWDCRDADVADASRAKVASDDTTTQVIAEFPQGVVILSFTTADAFPADLAYRDPSPDPAGLRLRD